MKLKYLFFFIFITYQLILKAEDSSRPDKGCTTSAGIILVDKNAVCLGDSISFTNHDALLDSDDTIIYIVCSKKSPDLKNVLFTVNTNKIGVDSLNVTPFIGYTLFAVAGNKVNSGLGIDPDDPCISFSKPITIQFPFFPKFIILPSDTILECGKFSIELNFQFFQPIYSSEVDIFWDTKDGHFVKIHPVYEFYKARIDKNGTYSLTIVNKIAGCSYSQDIVININTDPSIINLKRNELIGCEGSELELNASVFNFGQPFKVKWTSTSGNIISGDELLHPLINKEGIYYINIKDSKNGCEVSDSVIVSKVSDIQVDDLIYEGPACLGKLDGYIYVNGINGGMPSYKYSLNGETFSSSHFRNLDSGKYNISIDDAFGCHFDTVIALEAPTSFDIALGNDQVVDWGDKVSLQAILSVPINNLDTLVWINIDSASCKFCLEPEFIARESQVIKVIASKSSCRTQDEIMVTVSKPRNIYIPNSFSPNGDGINDRFVIYGGKNVSRIKKLEIFDRWGSNVFNTENLTPNSVQEGWDGTYKGKYLNASVFVYSALIEFADGGAEVFKGDITLIK